MHRSSSRPFRWSSSSSAPDNRRRRRRRTVIPSAELVLVRVFAAIVVLTVAMGYCFALFRITTMDNTRSAEHSQEDLVHSKSALRIVRESAKNNNDSDNTGNLPLGFQRVLDRAIQMRDRCNGLGLPLVARGSDSRNSTDLPDFGIIQALSNYRPVTTTQHQQWQQCNLPPETECDAQRFTVIFMGYRPDRLRKMKTQLLLMTTSSEWSDLIEEAILVWNGERELTESQDGQEIAALAEDTTTARRFRIFFPLKEGFPNDLFNRYHPRFNISTEAILFYDDDGPFYSHDAVLAGFELWKRNSNAQIGAMARRIDLSERQEVEFRAMDNDERGFISQCRSIGDKGRYNFQHFAQFGARMTLPSGSFLHRNYLCFLWHPVLEEVRHFVREHPVHPDDVTVSTIVSHVSGRAPKVYPRRINPKRIGETDMQIKRRKQRNGRRLDIDEAETFDGSEHFPRRKLLWADGDADEWARKRSDAVNSLLSYFGSVNSGSLGWCYGTAYHDKQDDTCVPELARYGMVPWLTEEHKAKDTCP
jgi:hypothetical protein